MSATQVKSQRSSRAEFRFAETEEMLLTPKRGALRCADLFAGAGGLSVGFHSAGFRSAFFNEFDQSAANTFQANFRGSVGFVEPIEDLTVAKIRTRADCESLDVVVGGPPCQGFSINAPIRTKSDSRNHLFRHYVRLVLEGLSPKFVLLENVPGLVSMNGGKTLRDVGAAFESAGYRVAFKVLNACHYGVPEDRWRLVMLGTRLKDIELSFPEPIHFSTRVANFSGGRDFTFRHAVRPPEDTLFQLLPPRSVEEAIGDLPLEAAGADHPQRYRLQPSCAYQEALRAQSLGVLNHVAAGLSPVNIQRISHVPPGGSWRDIPVHLLPEGMKRARRSDHTRRYGRLDPKDVSGTILTKCDPHWGTVVHYSQDRVLSVREAARIQSFPDWFRFTGSTAEMYRQVGNAVPPLLAKALALHIRRLLSARTGG